MTSFHEILFPLDIALKSAGGPQRRTDIVTLGSGAEERNARWAHSRRRYDAGYGVKTFDALSQVVAFFEERRGRLYGFRWRDRLDHSSAAPGAPVAPTDQVVGTGDGVTETFPLGKMYGALYSPYRRPIAKPVPESIRIAVAETEAEEGTHFTVDTATGIVTFLPGHVPSPARRSRRDSCSMCPCVSTPTTLKLISRPLPPARSRKSRWWRSGLNAKREGVLAFRPPCYICFHSRANRHSRRSNVRHVAKWTAPAAIVIFLANVQFAWSDQGLTGEVRTTFVEALMRSCLKTQLDAPGNKGVPVSAIHDYCKCNAADLADKISNDEVRSLEATGSEEKYRTAMQARMEASATMCLEAARKSLSK